PDAPASAPRRPSLRRALPISGSNLERERPCRHGWRPDAALLRVDDLRGARLAEQVPGQLRPLARGVDADPDGAVPEAVDVRVLLDRKSTRLNSSHVKISYAVF